MFLMSLPVVLTIIFMHYIGDFILQAEKWATNKSKSVSALIKHTLTYSLFMFLMSWVFFDFTVMNSLYFGVITFTLHTLTDYYTSRVVSKMFQENKYGTPIPNRGAFSVIGFDQVLHYIQLFLTYYILSQIN